MNETHLEQKVDQFSISLKTYRFWVGTTLFILVIFSTFNIFETFSLIHKFKQIYEDALPGKPLPQLTYLILVTKIPLQILALAWPVTGIIIILRQYKTALTWLNIGIILTLLQLIVTTYALSLPLFFDDISPMSAASDK